jgi:hypothetical protein
LIQLLEAREMHFQRGKLYPLGGEAVGDRVVLQVVPQEDHQHLLELIASRCPQKSLHLGRTDVVFEVYVEPQQPTIEVFLCPLEV